MAEYDPEPTVWLGVPDEKVPVDCCDALRSKIGGSPIWLIPPSPALEQILQCTRCQSALRFLAQAFAPLDETMDRVLYVFACDSADCSMHSECWAAVRQQRKYVPNPSTACGTAALPKRTDPVIDLSNLGSSSAQSSMAMLEQLLNARDEKLAAASTMASATVSAAASASASVIRSESESESQSRSGSGPGSPSPTNPSKSGKGKKSKRKTEYEKDAYFLDIFEEPVVEEEEDDDDDDGDDEGGGSGNERLAGSVGARGGEAIHDHDDDDDDDGGDDDMTPEELQKQMELLKMYESQTSTYDVTQGDWDAMEEMYASIRDPVFGKFYKRVQTEPHQVLRWQFGGEPLWATNQQPAYSDIPSCEACGSYRVFELQIMPPIILSLNCDVEKGMDFATACVYTCACSCEIDKGDERNWTLEYVWVQEPVSSERRPREISAAAAAASVSSRPSS
eukprot:ANDGO_06537.mRNA.1 putative 20S rRNA accumulation protein 4